MFRSLTDAECGSRFLAIALVVVTACILGGCSKKESLDPIDLEIKARNLTTKEMDLVRTLEPIPGSLWDATAADLNGDGKEELIVLMKEVITSALGRAPSASGIILVEDGRVNYLHHLPVSSLNSLDAIMDFNGDGIMDLMFTAATGGNCFQSSPAIVTWWDGKEFRDQDIGELKTVYDLDRDGRLEFETTLDWPGLTECGLDCETAMAGLRLLQYTPSAVWSWRGNVLVDASQDIDAYDNILRRNIDRTRNVLEDIKRDCSEPECQECRECLEAVECQLRCLELLGSDRGREQ